MLPVNESMSTWSLICCYITIVSSEPDVLLLMGMLMLGMALGALLTHIRQALTARIVQELEAKFGSKAESVEA